VERTSFYNVLAMTVDEPKGFLDRLERLFAERPDIAESVTHVFPAEQSFDFSSPTELESRAREAALAWVPRLTGRTFHVRVHRRGRRRTLVTPDVERGLADALLDAIRKTGNPARVTFDDPDAIVLVETIGGRAGIALLTRDDYRQHRLLATH
jgi:tRNA(Ser,Leu) C12 N-acetylase TAN1